MKRYIVFSFEEFYPNGGLLDVCFSSDDMGEAINIAEKESNEFCYVWDRVEDNILYDKNDRSKYKISYLLK